MRFLYVALLFWWAINWAFDSIFDKNTWAAFGISINATIKLDKKQAICTCCILKPVLLAGLWLDRILVDQVISISSRRTIKALFYCPIEKIYVFINFEFKLLQSISTLLLLGARSFLKLSVLHFVHPNFNKNVLQTYFNVVLVTCTAKIHSFKTSAFAWMCIPSRVSNLRIVLLSCFDELWSTLHQFLPNEFERQFFK